MRFINTNAHHKSLLLGKTVTFLAATNSAPPAQQLCPPLPPDPLPSSSAGQLQMHKLQRAPLPLEGSLWKSA